MAVLGAAALVVGCASTRSVSGPSTPTTAAISTTVPVSPTTGSPTTVSPTTVSPTTVTAPACPPAGTTTMLASTDPDLMSSLLGADIRTGAHPCYERVVIELMGTGEFPGWQVGYVTDPVPRGGSGDLVYLAGDATLDVRMGMWMQSMEGEGYQGDIQLFPTTVVHVLELRLVENWEGITVWAIGLDHEYPFMVSVLHSPERLVIDVYTG